MKRFCTEISIEPAPELSLPTIYYAGKSGYAIESDGVYIPLSETAVGQHLRKAGLKKQEVSSHLCDIRLSNYVAYVGPVAGHRAGVHLSEDANLPFLVTTGPSLLSGTPGEWPFLESFFEELLGTGEQKEAVIAWLRQARRNLSAGKRRPLPASVLVGPRNCGKSLFIEVARLALGGRSAPAFAALSGLSSFNSDIIGAELLTIDDEIASRDHRARTALAQGLKKHLFAGNVRAEAKGREPVALRPIQAVVIAVNNEPEHLQVLPTLDDSVADKISLFLCEQAKLEGLDDRDQIARLVRKELPAFVHYLDDSEHPEGLINNRTGCAAWQHPAVVEALHGIAPEERLRELMQQCGEITEAIQQKGFWRGSAADLERLLFEDIRTSRSANSLLRHTSACGNYLGRLKGSNRATIDRSIYQGIAQWTIRSLEQPTPHQEIILI